MTKEMKHLKEFDQLNKGQMSDEEIGGTDSFILTNGKVLHFWEEEQKGMAGELMWIWKFNVDRNDVSYKEIANLLKPEDRKEMEGLMDKTADSNPSAIEEEEENPLSGYTDQMGMGMAGYSDALVLYMDEVGREFKRGAEKLVNKYPDYRVTFAKNMAIITSNEGDPKHLRDIKEELGLLMPGE